jgi:hypothetical protein
MILDSTGDWRQRIPVEPMPLNSMLRQLSLSRISGNQPSQR